MPTIRRPDLALLAQAILIWRPPCSQQLGLKLEKRKGSVNLMIVDRLEQPSPN